MLLLHFLVLFKTMLFAIGFFSMFGQLLVPIFVGKQSSHLRATA